MNLLGPSPDALVPFLVFLAGAWQTGAWTGRAIMRIAASQGGDQ